MKKSIRAGAKAKPRQPTRRREIEIARTREDILLAAARQLGKSGYRSVSMQDIADEVGFTAPALYGYFESKDQIFAELGQMLEREMYATFEPAPRPEVSLRDNVIALVRRQAEWADRRREVFLSYMTAQMRGEALGYQQDQCGVLELNRRLANWLEQATGGADSLGGHATGDAAAALFGVCHGFFTRWIMSGSSDRFSDQTERIVDHFLYGVHGHRTT
jgi:AcrR family transcriptional regulator